jgi:hypothetical protein
MIETVLSAGSTQGQLNFAPQYYLQNKPHLMLETYTGNDQPLSPQGNTVWTLAQIQQCFVTFYTTDPGDPTTQGLWISNLPLIALHNMQNNTDPFVREKFLLMGQCIIWEKSYIQLPASGLGNGTDISLLLNVGFQQGAVDPTKAIS